MTLKPVPTSGRSKVKPQVQLDVQKEETFLIPLKDIDVTRSTHTDLDVLQEKRIDDYWNVDSTTHLSDSWRGFIKFILLKDKASHVVLEKTAKNVHDFQTRSWYGQKYGRELVKPLRIEKKTGMGKREAQTRQCSKSERNLLHRS